MPFFKSNLNIFKKPWEDEVFEPHWMDSNELHLPKTKVWDYKREMQIEDVDIWEVIFEGGGGKGVYAAWIPYAEFYMIKTGFELESKGLGVETYYGPGSQYLVQKRMVELNFPLNIKKVWVEPENEWLYHPPEDNKIVYSFSK